jgi:uncharacterized protein (DUF427 family)
MSTRARVLNTTMTNKSVLVPGLDHPITIEANPARVTVTFAGQTIASTRNALTLREASYPPVHYIPLQDVDPAVLVASDHATYCPYKGDAGYFSLRVDEVLVENAVWTYESPYDAVAAIRAHVAFYPDRVEAIDEHVTD